MAEPVTLAAIHRAVFDYLRDRDDTALFGSQAVNVYVDPPRMTEDVDVMALDAARVAEELRELLAGEFWIAARVREVARGRGFRVYQVRQGVNRHLVDVRQVDILPQTRVVDGVDVVTPDELAWLKLVSYAARRRTEKGVADRLDLLRLFRAFPRMRDGDVALGGRLHDAPPAVRAAWEELSRERLEPEEEW